jgi:hypothetical protein
MSAAEPTRATRTSATHIIIIPLQKQVSPNERVKKQINDIKKK